MTWIDKAEFPSTHRGQSRAFVDGVVALLAVVRLAVAAHAAHAVHAALVGAAGAENGVDASSKRSIVC